MRFHRIFLLVLATVFVSCNNDDDQISISESDFTNGFFVLNEGGIGEVTYVSIDLSTVEQDIFAGVNGDGQDLGAFVQSMFFDGDRAFIISNGSNKITVVNRYSFEYITTISTGLQVPRYGAVSNGKAFVTNLNDFTSATDDFITVIDLADLSVKGTIAVNDQAEKLIAHNGKLYIAGGFYGAADKLTVIDASSEEIITKITVPVAANSLEMHNETLFVLSGGFDVESSLSRINVADNTVINSIDLPSTMGNASNLDIAGNNMFFTSGPYIYRFDTDVTSITDSPFIDTQSNSFYIGYGFAVNNGRIYISEAADDFASDGKIFIYGADGTLLSEISTGLGPNGFYFN